MSKAYTRENMAKQAKAAKAFSPKSVPSTSREKFEEAIQERRKMQPRLPATHCAGILVANHFFHISSICEVAGAALEDANSHALAWLMFQAGKGELPKNLCHLIEKEMKKWLMIVPMWRLMIGDCFTIGNGKSVYRKIADGEYINVKTNAVHVGHEVAVKRLAA